MSDVLNIFIELVHNMTQSTLPGTIGVSLIFIYFAWILYMALTRVNETLKEDEHH